MKTGFKKKESSQDNQTRTANREQFPEIAEFVDYLREYFGDVKVVRLERVPGSRHGRPDQQPSESET